LSRSKLLTELPRRFEVGIGRIALRRLRGRDCGSYSIYNVRHADNNLQILEQGRVTANIAIVELLRKDSLEMTSADRIAVRDAVAASEGTHIIVTHGTDTMVETARELQGLPGKTIVLTGALQPARFADSDAAFNLGLAVGAVQVLSPGVYITANGQVFPAASVRKNIAQNRFEAV
jgi:L-asparaginase